MRSESPQPSTGFNDPAMVARYAEGPSRFVPGYAALQSMVTILLAERVPRDGRVLVLGAGGGLEMKAFAEAHRGWTFDGVDPSAEMLKLAGQTLGPLAPRAHLHEGYVDSAPPGPFDGATCLLTLHFMALEERQRAAAEIHRRLKPGAPYVLAHLSFPQGEGEGEGGSARALWLARHEAFLAAAGLDPGKAAETRKAIDTKTHIFAPEQDEAILREAGFSNVSLFYAAFSFRGWVATA
ncbi:MAG: class SAM-dependent methyltransferase [Reyranella sp.]|nr:class SAM-dependent methyltransferase [Reyranella sp.]